METNRDTKSNLKKELRKEILKKRDGLSLNEREKFSSIIRNKICSWKVYQECECLLCFVSLGSEVSTHRLIEDALNDGKEVYCPKVYDKEMSFLKISSMEDLLPGYYGILEPKDELPLFRNYNSKVLLIMPGSVFDRKKNRIGYGKGFYDRFLEENVPKIKELTTAALAFSLQIVDAIPVEKHDYTPEYLFTESEV